MRIKHIMASALAIAAATLAPLSVQAGDVEFWSPFTGPDGTAIDALVKEFNEGAGAEAGVNINLLISRGTTTTPSSRSRWHRVPRPTSP